MSEPNDYLPGAEEAQVEPEQVETLPAVISPTSTPLAARDAGIAAYLASAYGKAGTLRLTPEETKALKADFPDTDFVTGAAGKDSLIYIEAPALRNRMDEALGVGSWSHVSLRTWSENYKTSKGFDAVRVYHECVLIVRGVYICQAVGDMSYFPNNPEMNYGDAYQGSQSHSLRRCLRDFGVGLQAWSKTFQKGWFERQRSGNHPPPPATPPPTAPSPATKPDSKPKVATANTRAYVLDQLGAAEDGPARDTLTAYLVALGWLETGKVVEQWPYRFVPLTKEEIEALKVAMAEFSLNGTAVRPYQPHGLDPSTLQSTPVKEVKPATSGWAEYVIPFKPHKGKKLGKIPTAELEEFWRNFEIKESVTGPDGAEIPYPPEIIAGAKAFREALDAAGKELGFKEVA